MTLNQFFDQIYMINLDRRIDRRLKMTHQFDQIGLKVKTVSAVDGAKKTASKKPTHRLSLGEQAYIDTWRYILEESESLNYRYILCFDDDVWFHKDYVTIWQRFCERKSDKNLFLIYLGASQHASIDWTTAEKKGYYHPKYTDGSFAIGLSREAVKEVLTVMRNDVGYSLGPFDSGILRRVLRNERDLARSYVIVPNIAIADVTDSDLRVGRRQEEMAKKFHWTLDKYLLNRLSLPCVSVIVPVYNAEKTIWACLASLCNQTYPLIEIVVVDDGSYDQSWNLIQDFKQTYEACIRIVTERHHANRGCYFARNRGLKLATGSIIAFQDSDDVSLCYRIEEQVVVMWRERVLWTQCLILRTHLDQIHLDQPTETLAEIEKTRIHQKSHGEFRHCCAAVLGMVTGVFRRKVFDDVGTFKELPCGADAEFAERVLRHYSEVSLEGDQTAHHYLTEIGQIGGVFYKINKIMYLCHQMRPSNLTRKYSPEQRRTFQQEWRIQAHSA